MFPSSKSEISRRGFVGIRKPFSGTVVSHPIKLVRPGVVPLVEGDRLRRGRNPYPRRECGSVRERGTPYAYPRQTGISHLPAPGRLHHEAVQSLHAVERIPCPPFLSNRLLDLFTDRGLVFWPRAEL